MRDLGLVKVYESLRKVVSVDQLLERPISVQKIEKLNTN